MENVEAPVLIVGGGIVGLSAALFLQKRDIPFILVERNAVLSPLPRARGFSARTLELYRSVGLQEDIEAAAARAWKQGKFGGARRGSTLLDAEPLVQASVAALHAAADPSPCLLTACPQTLVEPVLRDALVARGGDLRFGWEMVRFEQDEDGVTAVLRDPAGHEQKVTASFLLGVDGARSTVRRALGIERHGDDAERYYLNIFFSADLTADVAGRTFSQCEIANDRAAGVFLAMDNATQWAFHLAYDPQRDKPEAWSEAVMADQVRAAIGRDVPVEILSHSIWNTRVRVADRYRVGHAFLLGDAAHVMPPWGGFNANTGIADAHNLAWRLEEVITGRAGSACLDAYETERRPVAVRNGLQARLRTDFEARFQIRTPANEATMNRIIDYGALHMRYRYGTDDTVETLFAQPGTRFPHAQIVFDGRIQSTLDLFGNGYVRIGGPTATGDGLRAEVDFTFVDRDVSWQSLTGLNDDQSILIRPDGFVDYPKAAPPL